MRKQASYVIGIVLSCGALWAAAGPPTELRTTKAPPQGSTPSSVAVSGGVTDAIGACCYHRPDGSVICVVASDVECQQTYKGVFQGAGTNCDPPHCDQIPTGACCVQSPGTPPKCYITFAIECELHQGQYLGDGSTCNPNPCNPTPTGACCYRDPATGQWACVIVSAAECDAQYGGLYQGDGSNCGPPLPCESPPPNGACCYQDSTGTVQCIVVSAYECDVVYHGVYHGNGSNCGPPNPCTELGACCYGQPGGSLCTVTTPALCQAQYQGVFQGYGTQCTTQGTCPSQSATGACCYATPPLCVIATIDDCNSIYGGTYMGANTSCTPNPCIPPNDGACCVLDNSGNSFCVIATQTECEETLHGAFHGVGSSCTPDLCPVTPPRCDCPGRCDNRTPRFEDPAFAAFTGPAAICTHYDPFVTGDSLVCVDLTNKGSAPLNTNWNATTLYSHPSWSIANLGTVFGLTVDNVGNIYVTASTSYNTQLTGLGGWGTVYKIDALTALPSVFANLPNTGPGLGNITYDSANNQFFVTNFEDGRIYRLDMAGNCLSTFDHATGLIGTCAPKAGDPPGFAALGERPWGVNVWNNRVYYGLWVEDGGRPSATASNTVWSIGLSGGNFTGTAQLEITLPPLSGFNFSNPPSDISFSQTGCMLVSERSMYSDMGASAHQSRVLEYRQIGPVWWPSAVTFQVGVLGAGANAAGGADYDKDGDVWATGDALQFGPQVIYGLQGLPCNGGGVTQSILVDLNGNLSFQDKTQIGDVEVTCFAARGACCYIDPTGPQCAIMTAAECDQLNGQYHGDNSTCGPPNPCDVPGACCVTDVAGNSLCVVVTQSECVQLLIGVWMGSGTPCTPQTCPRDETKCDCVAPCDSHTPAYEDPAFTPFTGPAVVATQCDPFYSGYMVVVVDIKNKGSAPLNTHWAAATRYSDPSWTPANLGTVFGVTVDRDGNIYVTASTSYFTHIMGPAGWGAVYKIDANTGAISTFAVLPNTGPGLGNITYDAADDQLFVTNFEDGRIYRLDMTGTCLGTFDHATGLIGTCAPKAGDPPGFVPLGERPWGVAVYNNRLYYGIWAEDFGRPSATAYNSIWSIALVGGNFSGVAQQEIQLPTLTTADIYSNPPSEINFSRTGCMLISERSMYADEQPSAHASRVLEYRKIGSVWWPSPNTYQVGVLGVNGSNSAGGADFDEDGGVWATGDALQFGPQYIYGVQGLPCTGGNPTSSILVDLNGVFTVADKTEIGALKVTCYGNCTKPPRKMVAWFPFDEASGTTAYDIAWGNNGTYNNPASILGWVQRARHFNGTTDYVRVPNAAQINFGQGTFSFDAWVRSTAVSGVQVILDKRAAAPQGYSFFLFNGRPGVQIASGGSFANYAPASIIADGKWHHVAVTFNRASLTGIKFYIDGAFVAAYSPLGIPGSVSNSNPLWIGVREPTLGGGGYFPGDLDEIEIFNVELSPTAIAKVYAAGRAGKCKERAYVPPVTSYCPYEDVKNVPFTIFNDSSNTFLHNWFLLGNANCMVPGPPLAGFSPNNIVGASIAGHSNQTWNVSVTRPPGLGVACYDGTVTNTTLGYQFGTSGTLRAANWRWCAIIWDPTGGVVAVPFPGTATVTFGVTNTGSDPAVFAYQFVAQSSDGDTTNQVVSLNGLPPGEPVFGVVAVDPFQTQPISVQVAFTEHQPFDFQDIILEADVDGDGTLDPLEALGIRSVVSAAPSVCPGDCDCDGRVAFSDIDFFVAAIPDNQPAWAVLYAARHGGQAPPCPFANCDANGDGHVNFADIDPFVALIPSTCP